MRSTLLLGTLVSFSALHAQIVINEVDYDQVGTDNAEYIEIKNIGTTDFPMEFVRVELVNGSGSGAAVYLTIENPAWPPLAPGGYFVICGNDALTVNCDHPATPATNLIQNGPQDAIALIFIPTGEILDALSYEGSLLGYVEGTGTSVGDSNTQDGVSLGRFPDGVDTDDNSVDFVLGCSTPGAANIEDPVNCDISTAVSSAMDGTSFTVLPSSDGQWLQLHFDAPGSSTVHFAVFTVEGRTQAVREVHADNAATWSLPVHDLGGQVLIVRATTNAGSSVRRVFVP